MQVTPSPEYPALQAQVKDPIVLVHAAFASQLSVPRMHSSISVKTNNTKFHQFFLLYHTFYGMHTNRQAYVIQKTSNL